MRLVLASTSIYRRALLARLRIPFEAVPPRFPELDRRSGLDPRELVVANALGKARSLAPDWPGLLIIGCDQVAICEGEILSKPGDEDRAVAQLLRLAGREHTLLNGLAVVRSQDPDGAAHETLRLTENRLRMRTLTRAEAQTYVRLDDPLDCAGSYKSEELGIALFEHIRGDDPTGVIGLPLIALCEVLREHGLNPLDPRTGGHGDARPRAPGQE
jgi:septum formation protein